MLTCTFEDGGTGKLRHVVTDNIVLDKSGQKILLVTRGPKYSEPGKLALPGGYLSPDESLVEGAVREIKEETGYESKMIELLAIVDNPNRLKEDRQNIAFVFVFEALGKVGAFDDEIAGVDWYDLNDLPDEEKFGFDHYNHIELLLERRKKKVKLPIIQSRY